MITKVNILYLKSPPTVATPSANSPTENTWNYHRNHLSSNPTFSLPPQHKNQNGESKCNKYNKLEQYDTKVNKIDRIVVLPHNREKLPFTNK